VLSRPVTRLLSTLSDSQGEKICENDIGYSATARVGGISSPSGRSLRGGAQSCLCHLLQHLLRPGDDLRLKMTGSQPED
jgi:hypothetical protein